MLLQVDQLELVPIKPLLPVYQLCLHRLQRGPALIEGGQLRFHLGDTGLKGLAIDLELLGLGIQRLLGSDQLLFPGLEGGLPLPVGLVGLRRAGLPLGQLLLLGTQASLQLLQGGLQLGNGGMPGVQFLLQALRLLKAL